MDYRLDRSELAASLEHLERLCWLFANLGLDPRYEEWFRSRAWVRTIHATTRIEGNSLNDVEVEEVLRGSSGRFDRREALEVLGTREALALADDIASRPKVALDERVIREIHRRVLDDIDPMLTPGQYRRGPNRVAGADGTIVFETALSGDVPDLMRRFAIWLRERSDTEVPPVAAALAHLEFVGIHPFYDGNGRTARALARLILLRNGYALNGMVSLDAYLDRERADYFAAIRRSLRRTYRRGYDATPFVTYFIEAINGAAEFTLARVKGLRRVLDVLREGSASGDLPARATEGLVYAWINGGIRPSDYVRVTSRTGPSAARDLREAERLGFLVATGETRARRYALGPKLRQIEVVRVTPFRREVPRSSPARPSHR